MKIKLGCPNCNKSFNEKGKYDNCIDKKITCPKCGFTTTKWTYNFLGYNKEEVDK
jgi:transposase-like protein